MPVACLRECLRNAYAAMFAGGVPSEERVDVQKHPACLAIATTVKVPIMLSVSPARGLSRPVPPSRAGHWMALRPAGGSSSAGESSPIDRRLPDAGG